MSKPTINCAHCGRDDFKTERGLIQHLKTKESCRNKEQEVISNNESRRRQQEVDRVRDLLANSESQARVTTRQQAANALASLHHDTDAVGPIFETRSSHSDQDLTMEAIESDSDQQDGYLDASETETLEDEQVSINEEEPADDRPSTKAIDHFHAFCDEMAGFVAPFTRSEESGIKLIDVLRKKKAPLNAYASVMDWHLREKGVLSDHMYLKHAGISNYIGRKSLIKRLSDRYNAGHLFPKEKVVKLPSSKEVVRIPIFDAEYGVAQLLTNPRLKDKDFDWFDDDPLAGPPENLNYIKNNNTGSAFTSTYHALINGPNQQLLGVIFYIDGATIGHFVDLPVTAVKMSLSCFTREARLREDTWFILGLIPQIKAADGRGKKIFKESQHLEADECAMFDGEGEQVDIDGNDSDLEDTMTEVKAQDFHFMLSVILDSFVKLTDTGMIWDLVYKNKLFPQIHFKFFVSMLKGDTEEADTLCGKYKPRTRNVKHICRQCHVPTMEASNHRATYPPKTQKEIERMVERGQLDKLKSISQQYIKNAWYRCPFNQANDRGVHGACPSEMLHAMQLGIFKYTRDIFFSYIGESAQVSHDINGLAKMYGKLLSRQSERSLPATNLSKGIRDAKIMAKDYRGVLLIMASVLRSTKGRSMLSTKARFRAETKKDDWILLVEILLEWEAYLCQPEMKKSHVIRLGKKHRYIMYIMKKVAKRSKGMGLNIMKFHGIVHLMDDILTNGVPLEFDTAACEGHHKTSKYAAKLTQLNESLFQFQVGVRLWEFNILDLALEELSTGHRISDYFDLHSDQSMSEMSLSSSESETTEADITTDDTRIEVFFDQEVGANGFTLKSKSEHVEKTAMNNDLLDFLVELQEKTSKYLPSGVLQIFTRHQRDEVIFHAHPNYRGKGSWKDWAVVDWGAGYGHLPCHLQAFVRLDAMPTGKDRLEFGGICLNDGVFAVVEEAKLEDVDDELKKSDLFVPFLKTVGGIDENGDVTGRTFFLADTDAIVKPCAMIPDIGGPPNRYFMVKPRSEWHQDFISWLERPHNEDEMSDGEETD